MSKTALQPRQIDAMLQQAVSLQQNGAPDVAETLYREILAARPKHFDAIQLLGALTLQSGRLDEGIALLKRAIAIDAKQPAIHSNLAFALNASQRYDDALAAANRALALRPDFADALNNRGNALAGLGHADQALSSFERALTVQPDFAQAWNNRACALRDLGRAADALASCDEAIARQPSYAEAWSNRGNALSDLNRADDAQQSYRRALDLAPGFADAWTNLGPTLIDLNRHADALASYDRALQLQRDSPEAHWNRSICLLSTGAFDEGWREFEWRWERQRVKPEQRGFTQALWLGDTPLDGKTILLHAEQGLGDTLQFCRYAADVARLGATVILEVPPELIRLLDGLAGVTQLVARGLPLPPFDCHCPLLSLPLAFHTTLSTIPAATPYLFADPAMTRQWAERCTQTAPRGLKVGLVWAGGNRPHVTELRKNDARRSMSLATLASLFDLPDVTFYSVQKGAAAQQLAAVNDTLDPARRIVDFTADLHDFADTAALVANLDLVISVDTSTAHLAGAMAKPVWILNRFDTCWRWLLERDDSPWYPDATLFRQAAPGEWDGVVERVRASLAERAARTERAAQ
ncbi:tetratricopeptide repeat protein [Paraburkholderia sp.]|uniref:tetratricopeptide repeat protein n=1 Tax=Paraburkholderia sp. TaxID=1926495 RepID=UPI002385AFC6|nr:tetratricopeptide repeat protein [Paraburkholderia sp.]MDE1181006.1 tetratricopeptide repeat protein [Paraburkholderia sp.]